MAAENRSFGASVEDYVQDIWRETALLQALAENPAKPLTAKCVMAFRCSDFNFGNTEIPPMIERYKKLFAQELGLKAADLRADNIKTDYYEKFIMLEGIFALDLANAEGGNHVFVSKRGDFTPVEIEVFELGTNQRIEDFPQIYMESLRNKRAKDFEVVRIYNERRLALDFRSALMTRENLTFRELRTFILSGLRTPKELA